jgi:hypothetical protein
MTPATRLYARYIELRHADGDMYPPDRDQFESFLNDPWGCTEYWGFYAGDELLAIAVVDAMLDGLSAIYTFYEPEAEARSLGRFAILWQIEHCRGARPALCLPRLLDSQLSQNGLQGGLPAPGTDDQSPVATRHRRPYREFLSGSPVLPVAGSRRRAT